VAVKVVVNYFMVMERLFMANGEGTTMQLLDLFAGLLWLSSVIFLLFVLDVIITRYLYRK
jgi:hypothetical protein